MKIKYIFKKLKSLRVKEYINHAKEVGKKVNKSWIYILFDMCLCALKYGSGYMDYYEFEFYLLNSDERKTYITGLINSNIVKKYNKKEDMYKLNDKTVFNNLYKEFLGREFLDLREVSFKEFVSFVKDKKKIVCKVIDSTGGKGVEVIDLSKYTFKNDYDYLKIYNQIMKKNEFLLEDYIVQHEDLAKLYSGSVNSLRVISFLDNNGVGRVLTTVLKIGNGASVDNFSSGGMYTFVNEEGIVMYPAIDEKGNIYEKHPLTNENIVGFKVPNFCLVAPLIDKLSKVVPTVRYIGWDIVITNDGIVVIEGNEFSGIFQVKPSISGVKEGSLAKFRKYMDI